MTITILKEIQSQNKRDKWHWSKRSKEKDEWYWEIKSVLKGSLSRLKYFSDDKKKVIITSMRKRLLDVPNLWGGSKGLIDSLVDLGLIKDDSPAFAEFEFRQCVGKPMGTIIEIEETR